MHMSFGDSHCNDKIWNVNNKKMHSNVKLFFLLEETCMSVFCLSWTESYCSYVYNTESNSYWVHDSEGHFDNQTLRTFKSLILNRRDTDFSERKFKNQMFETTISTIHIQA